MKPLRLAALAAVVLVPRLLFAACPVERGPVKSVTDADALDVRLVPISTTIAALHAIPSQRPLPHDERIAPAETTIHTVTATLIAYRKTPQGEIQLVLSDDQRRTLVATIPAVECLTGSRLISSITRARADFERRYTATNDFIEVRRAVEVQGVGFFDYFQGQRGLAPNGLSLHPVTSVDFFVPAPPKPPPASGRRRSVGSGGGTRSCARPTLTLTASRISACAGESVELSWSASDAAARVDIDGIGVALPASGNRRVSASASRVYSGRATTSCGASDEALAVVTVQPGASASLAGPSSVTKGSTGILSVSVSGVGSWTLRSSLGNAISPSFGGTSTTATYTAERAGTDTITLTTAGGTCGNVTRTFTISVTDAPATGGFIRCCDNTFSPTCTSCKQGCCSSHGGCSNC